MTKKRFKFGLAILGGLAALLLALLALVFVPTGASAGKGSAFWQEQGGGEHSGHPNSAYFEPPNGNGPNNNSHHSNNGAGPCVGTLCDSHDNGGQDSWHYAWGQDAQSNGQGQDQGNGHSPNNGSGDQGGQGNPWFVGGGYPGGGGGGGGGGYGAPHGESGSCASKKDKDEDSSDKESEDKTCDSDDNNNDDNSNSDAGSQQLTSLNDQNPSDDDSGDGSSGDTAGNVSLDLVNNDPPKGDDDDLPPVDPNCFPFTEGCDSHEGNPPNTNLTDPPTEVPEPLTLSLFAAGLTGAAVLRRRSRQKTVAQPD